MKKSAYTDQVKAMRSTRRGAGPRAVRFPDRKKKADKAACRGRVEGGE